MANINFYNIDNMGFMKSKPDNAYDLAIVDPPYGIGISKTINSAKRKKNNYLTTYKPKTWDNKTPDKEFWNELIRISKNQIVWGGNYFNLPISKGWIFWNKLFSENFSFSAGELAWTSFDIPLKKFDYGYWKNKNNISNNKKLAKAYIRIHPTQKPIDLYRWLLQNYAKPGDKILDTHGGSMSIAIACDMEGFDLDICEIDKDYFEAGKKRFETYRKQLSMTFPKAGGQKINIIQTNMFNSG